MTLVLSLTAEIVCLVAAIAASYVVLLLYRNPHRPAWLDKDWVNATFAIAAISILIVILAWLVSSLTPFGVLPVAALTVVAGLFIVTGWVLWKLMRMGWRLEEARQGRSPFTGRGGGIKGGGAAGRA